MTRVVFMGSAEFSVPTLLALQMAFDVVGVVTQPDRPAGRGRQVAANPVKSMALAAGRPVLQPVSLQASEAVDQLAAWSPEVIVVAAFGQILRPEVLNLPPHGCVNVHGSLLPRWRGAAPIPAAILAGDDETGVTIMLMDAGVDTGPVLAQESTTIEVDDTGGSLGARLAELGAQMLVDTLPAYLDGKLVSRPQRRAGATYAPPLTKADGWIDWRHPAERIDRQVRAYNPWPSAFTRWRGQQLKVLEGIPLPDWTGSEPPATVLSGDVCPLVATGVGALWLTRLQLAGKRAMAADAFVRGQPGFVGSVLGD